MVSLGNLKFPYLNFCSDWRSCNLFIFNLFLSHSSFYLTVQVVLKVFRDDRLHRETRELISTEEHLWRAALIQGPRILLFCFDLDIFFFVNLFCALKTWLPYLNIIIIPLNSKLVLVIWNLRLIILIGKLSIAVRMDWLISLYWIRKVLWLIWMIDRIPASDFLPLRLNLMSLIVLIWLHYTIVKPISFFANFELMLLLRLF